MLVSLNSYKSGAEKGRTTVDLRFVTEDDGKYYPTKSGCFVRLSDLLGLMKAMEIIEKEAHNLSIDTKMLTVKKVKKSYKKKKLPSLEESSDEN